MGVVDVDVVVDVVEEVLVEAVVDDAELSVEVEAVFVVPAVEEFDEVDVVFAEELISEAVLLLLILYIYNNYNTILFCIL